ncbi:MAG: hypothetical protein K1Y02_09600 [Candidatus Hydrogenedentes bacterium]|nr:hypothetical protein [Candidatus Hydrogenedentota bacterium]
MCSEGDVTVNTQTEDILGLHSLSADDVRNAVDIANPTVDGRRVVKLNSQILGDFSEKELRRGVVFRFSTGDVLALRHYHVLNRMAVAIAWNGVALPYPSDERKAFSSNVRQSYSLLLTHVFVGTILMLPSLAKYYSDRALIGVLIVTALTYLVIKVLCTKHPIIMARLGLGLYVLPFFLITAGILAGATTKGVVLFALLVLAGFVKTAPWMLLVMRLPMPDKTGRASGKGFSQYTPKWKRARIVDVSDEWCKCLLCGWALPLDFYPEGSECPNCWGKRRGPLDAVAKCDRDCLDTIPS